jgi:hypothetical protein
MSYWSYLVPRGTIRTISKCWVEGAQHREAYTHALRGPYPFYGERTFFDPAPDRAVGGGRDGGDETRGFCDGQERIGRV